MGERLRAQVGISVWVSGKQRGGNGDPSQVQNGWKKTHRNIIVVLKRSKVGKIQEAHERKMMSDAGVTYDLFSFHKCSVYVHVCVCVLIEATGCY